MGGEDNGTTIIKDGGQLGIEVFPIYFGEPCEGLGEITSGQTMTVTLPPGTTLGFKSTDADEDYDIVRPFHLGTLLSTFLYPLLLSKVHLIDY